jgi:hypothetical protein
VLVALDLVEIGVLVTAAVMLWFDLWEFGDGRGNWRWGEGVVRAEFWLSICLG